MCPPHPHPLRCHPPPSDIEAALNHEMQPEPLEGDFLSPPTSMTSSVTEEEPEPVGPLVFGETPPLRKGARFLELFGNREDAVKEIVKRIFSYLKLKSDERAFTFVDKSTFNLLLPCLYHSVTFDIARYPHNLIAVMNMMRTSNAGVHFIKRVTFDGSGVLDKSNPPAGFAYLASIVIIGLPEYQIERFDWPADFVLPEPYVLKLWESQDTLENISIYQETLMYKPYDMKSAFDYMFDLKALRVSADNREGLHHVYQILKEAEIQDLHLDLRTYVPSTHQYPNDPLRNEVAACVLRYGRSDGLHMFRNKISLTRLVLWSVDLSRSASMWLRAFQSKTLKEVELSTCTLPGPFLRGLATAQPFIEKIKIEHGLLDESLDADINTFLTELAYGPAEPVHSGPSSSSSSSSSTVKNRLKHLHIFIAEAIDPHFFDDGAITVHAPSLEVLSLDLVPIQDDYTPLEIAISDVLNGCDTMTLRQLCIPYSAFNDPKMLLRNINPVTLVFTEMYDPDCYEAGQVIANEALYKLRYEHKKNLKLRVFAFRVGGDSMDYFVRRQVSVMGRKQDIMVPVSYTEIRKFESEIDILEPVPAEFGERGRV